MLKLQDGDEGGDQIPGWWLTQDFDIIESVYFIYIYIARTVDVI